MNPIDQIVNDIFEAGGNARMRVLEEERNAAVLEAERARKERDCALARERETGSAWQEVLRAYHVLEEECNAAVLGAERARKERDCAMAREKVALEQPVCEYRAKFHDECRRTAEQVEAWAAERDRLKAALDCALERERVVLEQLHEARRVGSRLALEQSEGAAERDRLKAALDDARASYLQAASAPWASRALALENELNKTRAEWRDAVRATAEAKSMLADLEVSAQEADREAAEHESELLGELAEVKDALAMVHEALEAVTEREAALREERDRLRDNLAMAQAAAKRGQLELRELREALEASRKDAEEEREAQRRLVCLALSYEKGTHAVTRAMLKLAHDALESLEGKQ